MTAVDAASSVGGLPSYDCSAPCGCGLSFAGADTMTVRVVVDVRPEMPVTVTEAFPPQQKENVYAFDRQVPARQGYEITAARLESEATDVSDENKPWLRTAASRLLGGPTRMAATPRLAPARSATPPS